MSDTPADPISLCPLCGRAARRYRATGLPIMVSLARFGITNPDGSPTLACSRCWSRHDAAEKRGEPVRVGPSPDAPVSPCGRCGGDGNRSKRTKRHRRMSLRPFGITHPDGSDLFACARCFRREIARWEMGELRTRVKTEVREAIEARKAREGDSTLDTTPCASCGTSHGSGKPGFVAFRFTSVTHDGEVCFDCHRQERELPRNSRLKASEILANAEAVKRERLSKQTRPRCFRAVGRTADERDGPLVPARSEPVDRTGDFSEGENRMTSAEYCREHGFQVGDILEKQMSQDSSLRIRITAIGEDCVLGREVEVRFRDAVPSRWQPRDDSEHLRSFDFAAWTKVEPSP